MDGPWQISHRTADEYGRLANEAAKALQAFDPAWSSSSAGRPTPTCRPIRNGRPTVLDATYETVDYISLHMYCDNEDKNTRNSWR